MKLEKLQAFLQNKGWKFTYSEADGLGNLDFEYKGLRYRIWEFLETEPGAESNVRNPGRGEDFYGDYEETILKIMQQWQ